MKSTFMSAITSALFLLLLLPGCQQDEITTPSTKIGYRSHDCANVCIDPAAPVYYEETDLVIETSGPQFRRFDYTVYNTLTGLVVEWDYTASTNTPRKLEILVSGAGFSAPLTITSLCQQGPFSGSHTFNFTADWSACDVVLLTARLESCDGDIKVTKAGTYALVGECVTCDDESFSYTTENNLDIAFAYNAGAETGALTNAVVAFTFPQVQNLPLNGDGKYVAADGKIYSVNNPTNQTVLTWTGDIGCKTEEAVTFVFSHTPDCSAPPANDGQAMIWTDTKVNGVSVKGSNVNIVYTGCEN